MKTLPQEVKKSLSGIKVCLDEGYIIVPSFAKINFTWGWFILSLHDVAK
jgi:hypothetical protein